MINTNKAVAFDFAVSGNFSDICAAVIHDIDGCQVWPKPSSSAHKDKLSSIELTMIVHALNRYLENGYTIYGWGSLGFDLKLLYQEGIIKHDVIRLAYAHHDIMFQIFSETGQMASLYAIENIFPLVKASFAKNIPEMWKSHDPEKQRQVLEHLMSVTQRIYHIGETLQWATPITWVDYKNAFHSFKEVTKSCLFYVDFALQLPPAVLHNKWASTFEWIRQHNNQVIPVEPELPEAKPVPKDIAFMDTLREIEEIPF